MSVARSDPRNRETNRETNCDASADDGVPIHPQGSFFGRRKGHKLRSHQADLIEHLLPRLSLDIASPSPPDLADLFDPPAGDIRLEIGFGGGEHLIAEARAFPKVGFIGCEPYVNGMAKILAQIEAHNIGNVRLFAGAAAELLAWAPPHSLARIDLIHPDPWPKRRHWKRRFIQDESLKRLARVLKSGGELRFATDIAEYAAYALARVLRSKDFAWTAEVASDWRKPWPEFSGTRYEAKAKREGRVPAYFIFRKL